MNTLEPSILLTVCRSIVFIVNLYNSCLDVSMDIYGDRLFRCVDSLFTMHNTMGVAVF